jgi:methionine-R-sulfoxide reductase
MLKTHRRYQLVVFAAATMAVLASAYAWQTSSKTSSSASKATRPTGQKGVRMVQVKVFNKDGELVGPVEMPKVSHTAAEWRKLLTADQFKVLRSSGTERPFCGALLDNKKEGVYACAGCGLPLFTSDSKFHSGTGWPSFFQPIATENVAEKEDRSHGMVRIEVNCARCDGHLGHVFPDGPRPTGLRYCMNSESLQFTAKEDVAKLADPAAENAK